MLPNIELFSTTQLNTQLAVRIEALQFWRRSKPIDGVITQETIDERIVANESIIGQIKLELSRREDKTPS